MNASDETTPSSDGTHPSTRSPSWLPKLPQPPPVPDYNQRAQDSLAKAEAEVKAAEAKVEEMRSGRYSQAPRAKARAQDGFELELDWRGESAYYIEPTRRVWLFAAYWGGKGGLEHIDGKWEYSDGHRETLTSTERLEVLRKVRDRVRQREGFELVAKELDPAKP